MTTRPARIYVVVAQQDKGMVIQSRHTTYDGARARSMRMAKRSRDTIHAPLCLINRSRRRYNPGDTVDPADVAWDRVPDGCAECCDAFQPMSLTYYCPLSRGRPVCDAVAAARVMPLRVRKQE